MAIKKIVKGDFVRYEGRHPGYNIWVFAEMFKKMLDGLSEKTRKEVLKYLSS